MADESNQNLNEEVTLKLHSVVEEQLDNWRTTQSPVLSRVEAIARLVKRALNTPHIVNNPHSEF